MANIYREYMRHKAKMELSNDATQKRNSEIINDNVMRHGTTTSNGITNMADAYSQVRNSGHTPTPEEIDFRRFTSGSYVDKEPDK
ncbi:MAG: hypothetical protein VB913_02440 [Rhodospirillales bacterium]